MGNCFSLSLNLDNLCITCYDRNKEEIMYITEFQANLQTLNNSRNDLLAAKTDLQRRLHQLELEGPQIKRLQVVDQWLKSAEQKLIEADEMINNGETEIASKGGFCCCKNTVFSYSLGKSFVDTKAQLDSLKENGQFSLLVEEVLKEPKYITQLKKDLKDLSAAKIDLEAANNDLMRRVLNQEGGKNKRLDRVRAWMLQVDKVLTLADELLRIFPEEVIQEWQAQNFPDPEFGGKVSKVLEDVRKLRQEGDFKVVVECVDSEYLTKLQDNIKRLRTETRSLSALKDDVTERVRSEEDIHQRKELKQVKAWRKIAENRITSADHLLLIEAPGEMKKLENGETFSNFGEKVEKMLKDVVDQRNYGNFTEVTTTALPDPVVEIECDRTVGLQEKIDEVWAELMKAEVGILGLYGLGGVGKTTLLTHINNKFIGTLNDFDFVIWLVVSKDFSLPKIQEEIGERIGIAVNDWKRKDVRDKARDINNLLRRKKFVLLLDDVWDKVLLEKAGVPVPKKRNSAKIVFTTRSELVCSLMDARKRIKVNILPPDQAWILFEENVGKDTLSADETIRGLAESVVEECKGLPLALIVVARAMACCKEAEEWRYALKDLQRSASDLPGIKDEVFVRLKLSYDRLPDDKHRSCFIYCALFPEDFKIPKDDLIDYWVSEKFEDDENGESIPRAKALQILRHLISVCLLEEEGKYVKLHDMIRDMALWISCEFEKAKYNFLVQAGKQLAKAPDAEKWRGVKRTSLMENGIRDLPEVTCCPDLKTLLLCGNPRLNKINGSIFHYSRTLTVLNLSNTRLHLFPSGITDLLSLQYLNLSRTWIEELPRELKRLRKLIYLNLEHNDLLGMIPKGVISSFLSLQVLRMFRSGFFYEGVEDNILPDSKVHIEEVQQLKCLNVVSITITSADALRIYFTTENVQSCTRALSLEGLGRTKAVQFSPTEKMERLECLQISACEHLEKVNVRSTISCFSSLREVVVEYCPRILNLNWLAGAVNLGILRVVVCEKVVEVISGVGENGVAFGKLEVVELEGLPKLEKVCGEGLYLPAIKRMRVLDCPMLKRVPLNPEIIRVRKIIIEAEEKWWENVEFDDETDKETFLPSFRSYPPRTRICRAPHHYFDIWTSSIR